MKEALIHMGIGLKRISRTELRLAHSDIHCILLPIRELSLSGWSCVEVIVLSGAAITCSFIS